MHVRALKQKLPYKQWPKGALLSVCGFGGRRRAPQILQNLNPNPKTLNPIKPKP